MPSNAHLQLLLLLLLGVVGGCHKPSLPPALLPADVLPYRTSDGWVLGLRHYPGHGPPVMLVHGMGANHYNWDYRPEISFAYHLHQQGWDVWVPELRGDPGAIPPDRWAGRNYTFDDYATRDMPAALDAVLAATGAEQVYWVGHSMGGILLYTSLALFPERIAAGVSIGAPARFHHQGPLHRAARVGGWVVPAHGKLHNQVFYQFSRIFGAANPLYGVLANRDNLDWPTTRGLGAEALEDLSRGTVRQVHLWLRSGEVVDLKGQPWVRPSDREVPMLVLGGAVDQVAPHEDVGYACAVYPSCRFELLGLEAGYSADYGHIDPVVGTSAQREVYPLIAAFLAEQLPAGVALIPPGEQGWDPVVEHLPDSLPRRPALGASADSTEAVFSPQFGPAPARAADQLSPPTSGVP